MAAGLPPEGDALPGLKNYYRLGDSRSGRGGAGARRGAQRDQRNRAEPGTWVSARAKRAPTHRQSPRSWPARQWLPVAISGDSDRDQRKGFSRLSVQQVHRGSRAAISGSAISVSTARRRPAGTLHGSYKNIDRLEFRCNRQRARSMAGQVDAARDASAACRRRERATRLQEPAPPPRYINPTPSKNLVSYKYGAGTGIRISRGNVGARRGMGTLSISDGISDKINVNLISGSLLYRF